MHYPSLIVLTIFYECLCPDSRSFVVDQLTPAMEKLSNYTTIEFVPFGKAKVEKDELGRDKFTCQHGINECIGNKIHACVVKRAPDEKSKLKMVDCMIRQPFFPDISGRECSLKHNFNWREVERCAHGEEGNTLFKDYGHLTNSLNPPISFVPTILINKDRSNQEGILKNLLKVLCERLKKTIPNVPEVCKTRSTK